MRKRNVFKDLVNLAAEPSAPTKHLFVLGQQPIHFLRTSSSPASWGLDRFPAVQKIFFTTFGPLETAISEFVAGAGSVVELVDLEERWPELFVQVSQTL